MMVVFSVVFGHVAGLPSEGYLTPCSPGWAGALDVLFAYAVSRPPSVVSAATSDPGYRVYFPRLVILPTAAILAGLVDLASSLAVLSSWPRWSTGRWPGPGSWSLPALIFSWWWPASGRGSGWPRSTSGTGTSARPCPSWSRCGCSSPRGVLRQPVSKALAALSMRSIPWWGWWKPTGGPSLGPGPHIWPAVLDFDVLERSSYWSAGPCVLPPEERTFADVI